tara:strand:- start:285 stop:479 length:195 start_codon:yes stop_codon:yes gene_type:complete
MVNFFDTLIGTLEGTVKWPFDKKARTPKGKPVTKKYIADINIKSKIKKRNKLDKEINILRKYTR